MQALGSEEAGLARLAIRALANPSLLLLRNFQGRGAVWIRLTGLSESVRGVDVQARPGCGSRTASESPAWGGTDMGGTDSIRRAAKEGPPGMLSATPMSVSQASRSDFQGSREKTNEVDPSHARSTGHVMQRVRVLWPGKNRARRGSP